MKSVLLQQQRSTFEEIHHRPEGPAPLHRVAVRGKFLYAGNEKFYVRGVTYGTFAPNDDGEHVHDRERVERDFAAIAANGFNAVRLYTTPARWVLDAAARHGLRLMLGIAWEQHVTFLDDRRRLRAIQRRVRSAVRSCAGHPAVLCYVVGNEIPAAIVRWHGARRVERFLERLTRIVRSEDGEALVTYVNFPTTEYLAPSGLDFLCFNVYLEERERLEAYLARLQNAAGDRPLIMAEIGLDSRRNGAAEQARSLAWQLRAIFEAGCAGAFVFAWTDEWHRGGFEITDWDFGLTRRDREPKPALASVRRVLSDLPFPADRHWPNVTVVVCAYNAGATIRECLEGLRRLAYPNFDVVVVDDGSVDRTASIAAEYDVRLIRTPNRGLSSARNTGLEAASGEIVAYLDSDAFPDVHWLHYLAAMFVETDHAGVGGPNIAPFGGTPRDECFDRAPGGPVHVLLSDRVAEHIPGCNMAFRKKSLEAVGGFDPGLRVAGDDVDVCWRLQARGGTLGFAPGAMVWHHRRTTIASYLKQQRGYGRAEALLERKWPEKYNPLGHVTWGGRIYARTSPGLIRFRPRRIYHGIWGSAPYQQTRESVPGLAMSIAATPEWYLISGALGALSALGTLWRPLYAVGIAFAAAVSLPLANAAAAAQQAAFSRRPRATTSRVGRRALTGFLYLAQPVARLQGRFDYGLTFFRGAASWRLDVLRPRSWAMWSERWQDESAWLRTMCAGIAEQGAVPLPGGECARWDVEVKAGIFGSARVLMAVEEHGAGRQQLRFRIRPRLAPVSVGIAASLAALAVGAARDRARPASVLLAALAGGVALRAAREAAAAVRYIDNARACLEADTEAQG